MTRQDLVEKGFEDVVTFENPDFENCIIGISIDGRAIYSYSKMIEQFMKENDCDSDSAIDFIEYNTIRSLDYQKQETRPIIMNDVI